MEMYHPTKGEQFKDYYRNKIIMGISDDDYCINMRTFLIISYSFWKKPIMLHLF
jgi:hypothetical protein